jgi:hypothetical protein
LQIVKERFCPAQLPYGRQIYGEGAKKRDYSSLGGYVNRPSTFPHGVEGIAAGAFRCDTARH